MSDELDYSWRGAITDGEMIEFVNFHGGRPEARWWVRIGPHSLGWVTAPTSEGQLVGFVNVAWDGGDHAFLIDANTRGDWQRRGVGTEVVRRAAQHAKAAGSSGSTWTSNQTSRPPTSMYAASARRTRGLSAYTRSRDDRLLEMPVGYRHGGRRRPAAIGGAAPKMRNGTEPSRRG